MPDTLSRHELLALIIYATRSNTDRIEFARQNPIATDDLIIKELVTIGEPSAGITRSGMPMVTERGHALISFICKLPLPVATTTWTLPDDVADTDTNTGC